MTARGNARGTARWIARGNAHVVCVRSRQSSIEGVAVASTFPHLAASSRRRPRRRRLEGGARFTSPVGCEPRERVPPRPGRERGVSRCRVHLPPLRRLLQGVVLVRCVWGEPRGRNRGGPFRMLAWISRRPRPVSETRTCTGSSEVTAFLVSRAAIGPAGAAASPRRRLRPSSGRPRRATSPHTRSGEHLAGDPHQCRREGWRQR